MGRDCLLRQSSAQLALIEQRAFDGAKLACGTRIQPRPAPLVESYLLEWYLNERPVAKVGREFRSPGGVDAFFASSTHLRRGLFEQATFATGRLV